MVGESALIDNWAENRTWLDTTVFVNWVILRQRSYDRNNGNFLKGSEEYRQVLVFSNILVFRCSTSRHSIIFVSNSANLLLVSLFFFMLRATYSPVNNSTSYHVSSRPSLRVFGFGTIFITQKLLLNAYPEAGSAARAHNVQKTRGGHSANVLAILAQFRPQRHTAASPSPSSVRMIADVQFCGPLSGTDEGALISRELESQGISTMFSVVREGKSVPTAWVLEAGL